MEQVGQALYVGAGLFWKAFWALAFGYAFSSLIQVLVPRRAVPGVLNLAAIAVTGALLWLGWRGARNRSLSKGSSEP